MKAMRKGPKAERAAALTAAAMDVLTKGMTPQAASLAHGRDPSGKTVKDLVRSAKEMFAREAEFYVAAHKEATINAAAKGNAEPAQWALEHIVADGERVVEPAKMALTAPSLSIGIAVGGLPSRVDRSSITVEEVPAGQLEGGVTPP